MIRIVLICLLFAVSFHHTYPQDADPKTEIKLQKKAERKNRDKYLNTGTGIAFLKSLDQGTSPLLYKGFLFPCGNLGYHVHSEKIIKSLEGEAGYGNLHSRTETPWYDPRNTSYFIAGRFSLLLRTGRSRETRIHYFIGPEININAHFRINYKYGNSAFNFENFNGIGIAGRMEYPFSYSAREFRFLGLNLRRRDRNLILGWQVSFPVASLLIRPSYVTISHFTVPELQRKLTSDHIGGGFFIPFNIRSQLDLHYYLHNRNALRLCYVWNFYHHDPGYNKVQSAFHGWYFSFLYKFNKT
ncbi:MAG: hypothetical protein JXA03_07290 [Bacteroidales bacterium]|nr:hypothetical protein [Bacteroidales bacterium]